MWVQVPHPAQHLTDSLTNQGVSSVRAQVIKDEQNIRTIQVEVTPEELRGYFEATVDVYREQAQVEGFRKGKAPRPLIRKLFAADIEADALPVAMEDFMRKAIEITDTKLVEIGKIANLNYKPDQPLSFEFEAEYLPEFTLTHYKGLRVNREIRDITDHEVEETILKLRKEHATVREAEEAQPGYIVYADVQQLDENFLPVIGKHFKDRRIPLTTEFVRQDMIDGLTGVRKGEERRLTLDVSTPDDQNPKTENYAFTVQRIEEVVIPPADDDFARDLGFETLEKLREDVRRRLQLFWEAQSRRILKDRLIDAVISHNDIPAPEGYIKNGLEMVKSRFKKNYPKMEPDESYIQEKYRPSVIREVKWSLAMKKIVSAESLTVTQEDIDRYRLQQAQSRGAEPDQIQLRFKDDREKEEFDQFLLEEKVLRFLEQHAEITDIHETADKQINAGNASGLIG